jgi:hypothetical protein
LKHIKTNKKGKTVETFTYPFYNTEDYLIYILPYKNENGKNINVSIQAHKLFALVYEDNDDILRKDNVDHIDRIRCFCMPQNIRWTTSKENQNNKSGCIGKDDRQHTNEDITYLKDWIQHVKLTKAKGKDKYLKKLDVELKNLNNEVNNNKILEERKDKILEERYNDYTFLPIFYLSFLLIFYYYLLRYLIFRAPLLISLSNYLPLLLLST